MTRLQANLCLLGVTLCWSTEVIIYACIPADVTPFATTCITSVVGAILLFFLFFPRIAAALRAHAREILPRAVLLGLINCLYNLLYQFGLKDFDVSTGAFTLSLTAVILPVVLLVQRKGVNRRTWIAGALVLAGIICAFSGTIRANQLDGLSLIAVGCLLRAIFIIKLNEYVKQFDPVCLSSIMALAVGVITFIPWAVTQPATFAAITWSRTAIASLAIYSYFIIVFAQTLNFFAQRRATASNATIIYAMEIVFSVILGSFLPGYLIDRVPLTVPIVIGLIFVILGNIVEIFEPGAERKTDEAAAISQHDFRDSSAPGTERKTDEAAAVSQHVFCESGAPGTERKTDEAAAREENMDQMPAHRGADDKPAHLPRYHGRAGGIINMAVCYLMIAIPFKVLSVIPGFTDIRPVTLLGPAYAVFFGVPGCLVMAFGNLFMDIVSHSLRWSSVGGLIANFLGPYIIYLYWNHLARGASARRDSARAASNHGSSARADSAHTVSNRSSFTHADSSRGSFARAASAHTVSNRSSSTHAASAHGSSARAIPARTGFSLRTGPDLLRCVFIIIVSAIVEAVIITPMVALVYPDIDAGLFAVSVLLNTALFPIFFGMPAMMVMQEELGICPLSARR